jgi:hypothetical protein
MRRAGFPARFFFAAYAALREIDATFSRNGSAFSFMLFEF